MEKELESSKKDIALLQENYSLRTNDLSDTIEKIGQFKLEIVSLIFKDLYIIK